MCRKYSCKTTAALEIYPLAGSTVKPIGIPAPREVPSLVIRVFLYITSPCSFRTYSNIELVRTCNLELRIDCQIKGRKPKSTRIWNYRKLCLTLQSTLFSTLNSLSSSRMYSLKQLLAAQNLPILINKYPSSKNS